MSLLSKPTDLTEKVRDKKKSVARGEMLVKAFTKHIEDVNKTSYFNILEVEELVAKEQLHAIEVMKKKKTYPKHLPRFSPSSSDKCERELFFKDKKMERDEQTTYPFQNRWTRNSTAVHGAMQKQLLEAEIVLDTPEFKVMRLENGLPAWEKSIEGWKVIEHNGVQFVVFGMCDGILEYKDGTKVGFEYKTKSNSVAQIKQLKEPSPSHRMQCVAYSILFGVDEWLITYESVAKDKWGTHENARPDFKVFYHKVADWEKKQLLDKWSRVAENVDTGEIPEPNYGKCMFCQFKGICGKVGM
ncbi:PD-(D/E)XK nuclease family protein [Bacillus cereus]|uniref:PD-(D/E)XK nuclease family protein n=1 Tax=Bacillus cereus group TaxID=86661 RepID=UPI0022E1EB98|nr:MULTISPECIES: PD-(D/E)XK nuclease family protein [Bacillus cereus group]MDA1509641.1 PD-(D/E)XK nuclease family protein [Bacillus cereus group sp. TH36-2LC]MDZ4632238.1 PD-(D/E)XK nuclease family protein [Bacillus cereus]